MTNTKDLDMFVQEQLIKNKMMGLYKSISNHLDADTDWSKIIDIAYKEYESLLRIMDKLHSEMDGNDVFKVTEEQPTLEFFIYLLLLKMATMDVMIAKFIKGLK